MFKNKEFCIINGTSQWTKSDLEKKVVEYGGTITQNPGLYVIYVPKLKFKYVIHTFLCRLSGSSPIEYESFQ